MLIMLMLLIILAIPVILADRNRKDQENASVLNRIMLLETADTRHENWLKGLEMDIEAMSQKLNSSAPAPGPLNAPGPLAAPGPVLSRDQAPVPEMRSAPIPEQSPSPAMIRISSPMGKNPEAAQCRSAVQRLAIVPRPLEIPGTSEAESSLENMLDQDHKPAAAASSSPQPVSAEPAAQSAAPIISPAPSSLTIQAPEPVKRAYTEKASRMEMDFGGTFLNIIGIIFLISGIVFFLARQADNLTSGWSQCICGTALGLLMIFTGHYLYQKNMQKFAHPLIAGGFAILFFTICASYFHYHFIGTWLLFALIFATVAWSGISIFKYDSKLIGNAMLTAAFLAPFFMKFTFSGIAVISFYLVAVNLGVTYVAYYKKWDYYTTVAFLATYLLYFHHFHMTQPAHALGFLVVIYLLFLVSNNVLHFVRKSSSGYHVFLSYTSPVVFAVTSYFVVLKMANIWATLIYIGLAAIHLYLTCRASRMEEKDPAFGDIVKNNLVLGILFLTASISFITYFSTGTACFSIVTVLWLLEALALLKISFTWKGYELIVRRFSYLCLLLASAQLIYVIPTMEGSDTALSRMLINLVSFAGFFHYFATIYGNKAMTGIEEKFAMNASLISSMLIITFMAPFAASAAVVTIRNHSWSFAPLVLQAFYTVLAFLSLAVSLRHFSGCEKTFRRFSYVILALMAWSQVNPPQAAGSPLWAWYQCLAAQVTALCAFSVFFLIFYRRNLYHENEEKTAMYGALTLSFAALLILVKYYTLSFYARESLLYGLSFLCLLAGYRHFIPAGKAFTRFSFVLLFIALLDLPGALLTGGPMKVLSSAFLLCTTAALLNYAWFLTLMRRRSSPGKEEDLYMFISIVSSMALGGFELMALGKGALYLETAGAIISLAVIFLSFKYSDILKGCHNFGFLGLMAVTLALCFNSTGPSLAHYGTLCLIALIFSLAGAVMKTNESLLAKDEKWSVRAIPCMIALVIVKASLLCSTGALSTLIWALMALVILWIGSRKQDGEGLITLSQTLFFIAFIKSIILDANFVYSQGYFSLSPSGALVPADYFIILATIAAYSAGSRLIWQSHELRNLLIAMALFIFCFQLSFVLYKYYGMLDCFQVMLSCLWSLIAMFFINFGIRKELKIFRQFGLLLIIASILKSSFVDPWVLNPYDKISTFIIVGVLLMLTSFIYQKHRATIADRSQPRKIAANPA